MKILSYFVVGGAAGLLGGMGMGGGTVLIPALTLLFDAGQHQAQAVNLISFIPMAVCSLAVHFKEKRVNTKNVLFIVLPACIVSVVSSLAATATDGGVLKKIFGGFLVLLSFFQFFTVFRDKLHKLKDNFAQK